MTIVSSFMSARSAPASPVVLPWTSVLLMASSLGVVWVTRSRGAGSVAPVGLPGRSPGPALGYRRLAGRCRGPPSDQGAYQGVPRVRRTGGAPILTWGQVATKGADDGFELGRGPLRPEGSSERHRL